MKDQEKRQKLKDTAKRVKGKPKPGNGGKDAGPQAQEDGGNRVSEYNKAELYHLTTHS